MPQTIDVTGLPVDVIRAVESLIGLLHEKNAVHPTPQLSVFDLFGKTANQRTGADIAKQVADERAAWGDECA